MHQHPFLFRKEEEVEYGRRNTVTLEENVHELSKDTPSIGKGY